jgi:hypothetical protein
MKEHLIAFSYGMIAIMLTARGHTMIKWYRFLRKQGYSRRLSFSNAIYNSKHWYPEGVWPYEMKKKMKEHLIAFSYGMIAMILAIFIVWILLMLVGQEMIILGLLMIVTWGIGMSIRDSVKDE